MSESEKIPNNPPKYRMVTWYLPTPLYSRLVLRHNQVVLELRRMAANASDPPPIDESEEAFGLSLLELGLRILDEEEQRAKDAERRIVIP